MEPTRHTHVGKKNTFLPLPVHSLPRSLPLSQPNQQLLFQTSCNPICKYVLELLNYMQTWFSFSLFIWVESALSFPYLRLFKQFIKVMLGNV
jgi:hypothetical protein